MEKLIAKIMQKKELSSLSKSFVEKILKEVISEKKDFFSELEKKNYNPKSKEYKFFVKEVRKRLRVVYGSFDEDKESVKKLIDEKKYDEALKKHVSTRERLPFYGEFLELISGKKIMDLGCGLNPLAFKKEYIENYLAIDIGQEVELVNRYFENEKIRGDAKLLDLSDKSVVRELVNVSANFDVCLMLKLVDTLESTTRDITDELLKMKCKKIISFPLQSIGGKKIAPQRNWFKKKAGKYDRKVIGNEEFFIVE